MFADAGCGNCHTMKAANATGTTGPNLDELKPNEETVVRQVTNGGNGMPSFKDELTAAQIQEVAAFVATAAGAGSAGKISFEPDDKTVDDCGQDAACFEQAFGNLAYEEGPGAALEKLAELQSSNPVVAGGCHPIAHKIGAGGLLHFEGDVGKAFADGDGTCGSGFYHGLLQWKLAGAESRPGRRRRGQRLQRPGDQGERFHLLPVRPRPRPRADALHGVRPAESARLLPQAEHGVRPGLLQRRRLHGEPELVVRPPHEVAAARRTCSTPATASSSTAKTSSTATSSSPRTSSPTSTATGRRRPTGAGRASAPGSSTASSPTAATSPAMPGEIPRA